MPNRAVGGTPRRRVGRVAGAAAILLATVSSACARSDEDRIRRRLEGLAQVVSIEDSATPMIRQALATHLTTYLTPDANVEIGAPFSPVVGRDAVRGGGGGGAGAGRWRAGRVRRRAGDGRRLATVIVSVMAGPAVGGQLLQARELEMVFSEVGGEWRIEWVRLVGIR